MIVLWILFYVCFTSSLLFAAGRDLPEGFFAEPASPILGLRHHAASAAAAVRPEQAERVSGDCAAAAASSSSSSSSSSSEQRRLTPQEYIMGWVADQYEKKGDWAKAVYFYRHAVKLEKAKKVFERVRPECVRILFKDTSELPDEKLYDAVSNEMLRNHIINSDWTVQELIKEAIPAVRRRAGEEDPFDILNIDKKALERQAQAVIDHKAHEAIALVKGLQKEENKDAWAKKLSQEYVTKNAFFMAGQMLVPAKDAPEALFWLIVDVTFPCARSSDIAQDLLRTVAQPDQYTQLLPEIISLAEREKYVDIIELLSTVKNLENRNGIMIPGQTPLL
ncbi:hypothetical protein EBR77_02185, partial [bacterium]|nr:hypothetical protein [bacterium]